MSAGFDPHARDPLAQMELTERGFAAMCTAARASWPRRPLRGRLVLVLEGGYDLTGCASPARGCLEVLAGRDRELPHRGPTGAAGGGASRQALAGSGGCR